MRSALTGLVLTFLVLAGCEAKDNNFASQVIDLTGGGRIAGTGDLGEPRFSQSSGNFLAFTQFRLDRPDDVFRTQMITLQTDLVSKRTLGAGELPQLGDLLVPGQNVFETVAIANDDSFSGSISSTGETTAFVSFATNLLPLGDRIRFGITPDIAQAYVRNDIDGTNELMSFNTDTWQAANRSVTSAMMSANRRYVAYASEATNIVPDRANTGISQIFVHDRAVERTFLLSIAASGVVAANGGCFDPVISAAGRYIAFRSFADNLVDGDTNSSADIYVYDRSLNVMTRVSLDGMAQRFLDADEPEIASDASVIAFSALDTTGNAFRQIFAYDMAAGTVQLVSTGGLATPGNRDSGSPAVSFDGTYIGFDSDASNLVAGDSGSFRDVFLFSRLPMVMARLSQNAAGVEGDADSWTPTISPDNVIIAFASRATNLLPETAPVASPGNSNQRVPDFQQNIILLPNPLLP